MNQVLFFSEKILGHATITLPSIRSSKFRAGAGDHVSATAVVAYATSRDVVDNDTITDLESSTAGAGGNDPACRLVPCDHALVAFRTFTQMLVIDRADVRSADG